MRRGPLAVAFQRSKDGVICASLCTLIAFRGAKSNSVGFHTRSSALLQTDFCLAVAVLYGFLSTGGKTEQ